MGKLHQKYLNKMAAKVNALTEQQIAQQKDIPGVIELTDVPYLSDQLGAHLLDIYYPEGAADALPVIVDVHGGGFICGSKEVNRIFNKKLALHGFAVVSINYRLIDGRHCYKDQMQDVFSACHWLWANSGNYPMDCGRVYLCGDSAGGHITLMAANIVGIIQLMGAYEVQPLPFGQFNAIAVISATIGAQSPMGYLVAPTRREIEGAYHGDPLFCGYFPKIFQPDHFPPTYIVTSNGDFLRKDSRVLASMLAEENIPFQFHDWAEKKDHVFCVADPYREDSIMTINEIAVFFKKY